jgi:general stress protein 26
LQQFTTAPVLEVSSGDHPASERQRVRALIQRAGVAMLMTIDENTVPVARPMLPLLLENDPCLYFLTDQNSRKVSHITARSQVGLTMISKGCYLVVTGTASTSREQGLIQRLWQPTYRAWFPEGNEDREATVLRVTVDRVDYWEPARSGVIRIAQAVKAVLTRRAVETPKKTITGL